MPEAVRTKGRRRKKRLELASAKLKAGWLMSSITAASATRTCLHQGVEHAAG